MTAPTKAQIERARLICAKYCNDTQIGSYVAEGFIQGRYDGENQMQIALAALTEAADEIASLRARVEAYRLLAVNEGWKHIMVEAYGHREYLRQRVEEVDRKAAGTVASGYDAAAYLRDALKDTPVE